MGEFVRYRTDRDHTMIHRKVGTRFTASAMYRPPRIQQPIPILMYHSISSSATRAFRPCIVPPDVFEEHLAYLKQHDYTSLTATQLVQAMSNAGASLPARPVVLTFDDAYADFYTSALPALQHYGFSATLYVPTAFVGNTSRWLQNLGEGARPLLSWSQLTEISTHNIECGAHTHTHPALDMLPLAQARAEIVSSKQLLEDHLGQRVLSFAYPFGYYSARVRRIVQEAGFSSACAIRLTISSLNDDPYALARIAITSDITVPDLAVALSGRGKLVSSALRQLPAHARQYARSTYGRLQSALKKTAYAEISVHSESI
jgi:peptidoglycan/xylan/chitin deacetylase (PgdA/CDA1 family)